MSTKDDRMPSEPIRLDATELLGFSQIIKVAGDYTGTGSSDLGRLLCKIGLAETDCPQLGRLLNKVGAGENCT
jgi:hypothetical protein